MNETGCERTRERIPDFVAGRVPPALRAEIEAHIGECAECRDEAELVALLLASRPSAPPELAPRIEKAVRLLPSSAARRPWWGLAAAAVAALALGIGVASRHDRTTSDLSAYVADTETEGLWLSDDGLIAGAPALDALSDDALVQLLDEMGSGGQA